LLPPPPRVTLGVRSEAILMIARTSVIAVALLALAPAVHAAGGPDDHAESRLGEQEALVEARERRVRSLADELEAKDGAARAEALRLEDLEQTLAAYEKGLDAREQWIIARGLTSSEARQLESREAQLAAQERAFAAQERTLGPVIDAATGREKDAATREEAERREASRLAAKVGAAGAGGPELEVRNQVLSARNRQLAAAEAGLRAWGERIAGVEQQLRAKAERVEARSRLLDTRAERLQLLLEQRASPPSPSSPQATKVPAPAAAKDVVVLIVKAPTAIVRERGSVAPSGAPPPTGMAAEPVVAAATVVAFASATSSVPELDGEAIDHVARVAAKESCEVLIWARAKDQSFMAEAQRRADDIRIRVLASGSLPERRAVTRITTRQGIQRVDVVVSALRDTASPATSAATGGASSLAAGEAGKRQIVEAVQAAQPLIEGCIGTHLQTRRLRRAEGTLKLTVASTGKVQIVRAAGTELGSEALDACLAASAARWQLPSAEGPYSAEVPITVVRGGAK
jgi:hypothetical protein